MYKRALDSSVRMAKLLDNGNFLANNLRELTWSGTLVWEYSRTQHHDFLKLPNGNVLFLSRFVIPREEAIALGVNPDNLRCPKLGATHIIEVRPIGPGDGEIVWQWSPLDHIIQDFDPEKLNYGAVADHPELVNVNFNLASAECRPDGRADWLHANALDYNADTDQVMVTVRHFSEVWVIDRSTSIEEAAGHAGGNAGMGGDLIYRWGNPRAYQRGTAEDQRLFWPHDAHWIPEGLPGAGNVLIFNNGAEYPGFERGYSSVDEVALPADGHGYRLNEGAVYGPNEVVWRYTAAPPQAFYAERGSFAQRLPNGATLITHGPASRILEVTREGKNVWEFVVNDVDMLYSHRYAPDHPGIQFLLAARQAATAGEPLARSAFNLYETDGDLVYNKENCGQEDTEGRFFLHIVPERVDDLPRERREFGFDNLDFDFFARGALFDGKCLATVPLPDYAIASIRTGQFVRGEGEIWRADFAVGGGAPPLPAR